MTLIEKAVEKLSPQSRSLIERAMEQNVPYGLADDAAVKTDAPSSEIMLSKATPAVPSRSREFSIDLTYLASQGLVIPSARSRLSEEIRLIKQRLMSRMRLFGQAKDERTGPLDNVVMVTSARPNEGKSFLTINLALSLIADEGLNVLVIDADPVHRSILSLLGISAERGLVDLLRDPTLDMGDCMLRDSEFRFSVLPSGNSAVSSTELFSSPRMQEFLIKTAERYNDRIILFDCPPLLASTEPLAIARFVGQVLVVVEANRTPERTVRAALELLEPGQNISLVLNKTTVSHGSDQFGTYYEAYGGKRKS